MGREEEHEAYQQLPFADFENVNPQEVTLENVIVQSLPIGKKQDKSYAWGCSVFCPPDIFNQDRSDSYEVHANAYAPEAKKMRLRPGDLVTLKGVPYTQEIETANGKKTVNHFTVSEIEIISRAKRVSITVYERKRGK